MKLSHFQIKNVKIRTGGGASVREGEPYISARRRPPPSCCFTGNTFLFAVLLPSQHLLESCPAVQFTCSFVSGQA